MADELSRTTATAYDAMNRRVSVTDALSGVILWEYDERGNVKKKMDQNNHSMTFTYDSRDRQLTETNAIGATTTWAYDENGNIASITDALGRITYQKYDALDRQIKIIRKVEDTIDIIDSDDVVSKTVYDSVGNIAVQIDPLNRYTYFKYDAKNRQIKVIRKVEDSIDTIDADDAVSETVFDNLGNRVSTIDPEGKVTYFKYDELNRLTQTIRKVEDTLDVIDDNDVVTTTTYDVVGNQTSITDANNKVTYMKYDELNRQIKVIRKVGDRADIIDDDDAVIGKTYDIVGNVLSRRQANGVTTSQSYDAINRVVSHANGAGEKTTMAYDAVGNRIQRTLSNGNIIQNTYDNVNRLLQSVDIIGRFASQTYDLVGNKLTNTDGNGNTIVNIYDDLNRLIEIQDTLGKTTKHTFDKANNPILTEDRSGNITTMFYNDLDQQISIVDVLGRTTTFQYDKVGNFLAIADPKKQITSYEYDDLYRRLRTIYADGSQIQMSYDKVGNRLTKKDQKGIVTSYHYNDLYFLTKRKYPTEVDDNFSYDKTGRMLTAKKDGWLVTFIYDGVGRIIQTTQNGKTIAYNYDVFNGIITLSYPNGRVVTRKIDKRGRLLQIKDTGVIPIVHYSYDLGNRAQTRIYRNGVEALYSYNTNDWLTRLEYRKDGALLQGFAYSYDHEGNTLIAKKTHAPALSETYQYDSIYRLTNFKRGLLVDGMIATPTTQTTFTLDLLSNWDSQTTNGITEIRSHSEINEIKAIDGLTLNHDPNGNLTNDRRTIYSYDIENRLIKVARKSDGVVLAEYQYDALGRRVRKKLDTKSFLYYYNGQQVIEERESSDQIVRQFIDGLSIDDHLTQDIYNSSGLEKTLFYLSNHRGDTMGLTDTNGTLMQQMEYTPYGKIAIINEQGDLEPLQNFTLTYGFQGRRIDGETRNYYFRTRYYSASLGRFFQRDSLEFIDSYNLYEFGLSNPLIFTDAEGKSVWKWLKRLKHLWKNRKKITELRDTAERLKKLSDQKTKELNTLLNQVKRVEKRCNPSEAKQLKKLNEEADKLLKNLKNLEILRETKRRELRKLLGGAIAPTLMIILQNPNATFGDLVSAGTWDVASAIDPIGVTDVIGGAVGLGE